MKTALLTITSLFLLSAAHAQDLPDGKGKDVTERVCTACHGLDAVTAMHAPKDVWSDLVDDMKSRGADGTKADFEDIISYLSKYFGPEINVNKATAKEIQTGLDLTDAESAAIVKYRTDNGSIKDFADLTKVSGVDAKKLEPLKARIKF